MAVQTQIQVRRGTAATWTSTNPTLAAGEWGLETDTGKYKVGTGSAVWTSLGYASILPSTVTTKGDLLAATGNAAVSRLAVGSDGYTLVADSSTSTGLAYSPTFFAGKNKIINGDFGIWQRGTSFSNPAASTYTADRFLVSYDGTGATRTISQQTFTPATAPVTGYEGSYFLRCATTAAGTGNTYTSIEQKIEDVRTYAGQTVTLSVWLKADSARTVYFNIFQVFGSGGSSVVGLGSLGNLSVTTSWQRFTMTAAIPSISGKTIGTGSNLAVVMYAPAGVATIDTWGWQLEAGSTATQFQTATGTIQGELAACQRYYERQGGAGNYNHFGAGYAALSTKYLGMLNFSVQKRTSPSFTFTTASNYAVLWGDESIAAASAITADQITVNAARLKLTTTGLTQGQGGLFLSNNTTNGYIEISSEL